MDSRARLGRFDQECDVSDLDVSIRNVMTTACRSAPEELRLQCIQLLLLLSFSG